MQWQHPILKAKPYHDGKHRHHVRFAHQKMDGHRLTVMKDAGKVIALTSTFDNLYPVLRERYPWAEHFDRMPDKSSLDGELHIPKCTASIVKTALKEANPLLVFQPFAVPWWDGNNLALESVHRAADVALAAGFSFVPYAELRDDWTVQQLLETAQADDLEGFVLKKVNYGSWYKIKCERTIDLIVTGIQPGKGKYIGQCGALIVSTVEGHEVAAVSGMTDAQRVQITEADIGRIVEVRYQCVGTQGRLRHPRFVRWRDNDKQRERCDTSQDLSLWRIWNRSSS